MDLRRDRSRLHAYFNVVRKGLAALLPGAGGPKSDPAEADADGLHDARGSSAGACAVKLEPPAPAQAVKLEPAATDQAAVMGCPAAPAAADSSSSGWSEHLTLAADERPGEGCRSALPPGTGGSTSPGGEDTVVDVEAIDREEQARLWAQITACTRKRAGPPGVLRQDSLKRFFRAADGGGLA